MAKTILEKAYEKANELIIIDGYDFSRALSESAEAYDLTESQESDLFRMWYENNSSIT